MKDIRREGGANSVFFCKSTDKMPSFSQKIVL